MTGLEVRTAEPGDLEAVVSLLREDAITPVAPTPSATERQRAAFDEICADPHADLLVGEADGQLVATALVNWLRVLVYDGGMVCQVESVRTASAWRGGGLGTALMEHVIEQARERGCGRVQLTTNVVRTRAQAFYERLGFLPSHVGMKLSLIESSRGSP